MVFSSQSRSTLRQNDKTWLGKLVIRILLIICALIALGCIAWSTGRIVSAYSGSGASLDGGSIVTAVSLVPICLALVWSFISIVVVLVRSKPMHPGVHVGVDLILLIILFILAILTTLVASFRLACVISGEDYSSDYTCVDFLYKRSAMPQYSDYGDYGSTYSGDYGSYGSYGDYDTGYDSSFSKTLYIVTLVGCVFMFIVCLFEFILFVWACVDTHRYRRNKGGMAPTGNGNTMGGGGYAIPPQQQMVQPSGYAQQPHPFYAKQQGFYTPPQSQSPYDPPYQQQQQQQQQQNLTPAPYGGSQYSAGSGGHGYRGVSSSHPGSAVGGVSPVVNSTYPQQQQQQQHDPRQPSPISNDGRDVNGNGSGNMWHPQPGYSQTPTQNTTYYPPPT